MVLFKLNKTKVKKQSDSLLYLFYYLLFLLYTLTTKE